MAEVLLTLIRLQMCLLSSPHRPVRGVGEMVTVVSINILPAAAPAGRRAMGSNRRGRPLTGCQVQ